MDSLQQSTACFLSSLDVLKSGSFADLLYAVAVISTRIGIVLLATFSVFAST